MGNAMVMVATFSLEPDAYIAHGMLVNNGIDAYVETNSMATLYGAGSTWAAIKLLVPEKDFDRAVELLREHGDII